MTSPSSSALMRMMPCIAGCCGPSPSCIRSAPAPVPVPSPSMNSRVVVGRDCVVAMLVGGTDERLAPIDRVILPQRMAHELLVHEEPPQVRMAVEADAEHRSEEHTSELQSHSFIS